MANIYDGTFVLGNTSATTLCNTSATKNYI